MKTCSIPGCARTHEAKGLCSAHYMRVQRHGVPDFRPRPRPSYTREGLKICSKCKTPKELGEFIKDPVKGPKSWCKECSNAVQKDRYEVDVNRRRSKKEGNIKLKYGLTPEAWKGLFEKQQGVCAICKNPETQNKRISVDHDHQTGKVRGLLCNNCNRGLGLLKDSLHTLVAAVEYLKSSASTNCSGPCPPPVEARSLVPPAQDYLSAPCSRGYRLAHCSASLLPAL